MNLAGSEITTARSEGLTHNNPRVTFGSPQQITPQHVVGLMNTAAHAMEHMAITKFMLQADEVTGGSILLSPEFKFLPAFIGRDGLPVFVYQLVGLIDEIVNYDEIEAEFPTLSYTQISSAIAFIRKLAQFNTQDLDIDKLEDDLFERDPEFIAELSKAASDKEISRVLNAQ